MPEKWLQQLEHQFICMEKDLGTDAHMKVGPIRFKVRQWEVQGIGNLCHMSGSALFGLMKMDTLILTPICRDTPLFSYDRIHAMGKDTMLIEFYNTQLGALDLFKPQLDKIRQQHERLKNFANYSTGERWYDDLKLPESLAKTNRKACAVFDDTFYEIFETYLDFFTTAPSCSAWEKCCKTKEYVDGLLTNGGASTDHFLKAFGKKRTDDIFYNILFGIR